MARFTSSAASRVLRPSDGGACRYIEDGYGRAMHGLDDIEASDGDVVAPALIPRA
jgi:hypothetical protein